MQHDVFAAAVKDWATEVNAQEAASFASADETLRGFPRVAVIGSDTVKGFAVSMPTLIDALLVDAVKYESLHVRAWSEQLKVYARLETSLAKANKAKAAADLALTSAAAAKDPAKVQLAAETARIVSEEAAAKLTMCQRGMVLSGAFRFARDHADALRIAMSMTFISQRSVHAALVNICDGFVTNAGLDPGALLGQAARVPGLGYLDGSS